jgi:hypothetical protein
MNPELIIEEHELDKNSEDSSKEELKVVIHLSTGEITKGYVEAGDKDNPTLCVKTADGRDCGAVSVRVLGVKETLPVQIRDVKSIFFVKSFRGDPKRKGLRFYNDGPAVGSIWVEIQFKDNEIIEGLIENSLQHLIGNGFLLKPSDPGSNNICIYVNKGAIASYRVLGVKALR